MRFFTFALAGLATTAFAAKDLPKHSDHKDFEKEAAAKNGAPKHPAGYSPEKYHKLTEDFVCDRLNGFAEEAEFIFELAKVLECGDDRNRCWEPVRKAIYELEFSLDLFDTDIDNSDLSKCWTCSQESKISCCYRTYAEALVRALNIIAERIPYLKGDTAKYIITAVSSLRAADYTFVYELVRRQQCEEFELEIMEKQGALDGSTPRSIREAFSKFVYTPLITGDDFKVHPNKDSFRLPEGEVIDEIQRKNKHHHKGGKPSKHWEEKEARPVPEHEHEPEHGQEDKQGPQPIANVQA